jgi:adenylosuccinate lyase
MQASGEGQPFAEVLKKNPRIASLLSDQEINETLDPTRYLGQASAAIDAVLENK